MSAVLKDGQCIVCIMARECKNVDIAYISGGVTAIAAETDAVDFMGDFCERHERLFVQMMNAALGGNQARGFKPLG